MVPAYSEPGKVMDPITLLIALKRRWLLALSLGLLTGAMAAATVWYVWPPEGSCAVATLSIEQNEPHVFQPGLVPNVEFNIYRRTQRVLIKSRTVAEAALKMKGVADLGVVKNSPDPIGLITGGLAAEFESAPDILTVYLGGPEQYQADLPILLDAVIEAYLNEIVRKQKSGKSKRMEILENMYKGCAERVASNRETLDALAKLGGTPKSEWSDQQMKFFREQLNRAEAKLITIQDELEDLQSEKEDKEEQLKNLSETPISPEAIDKYIDKDPEVRMLQEALAEQQGILDSYNPKIFDTGKDHPIYQAQLHTVENLRKDLQSRRDEYREEATNALREELQGKEEREVAQLEWKIHSRRKSEASAKRTVENLRTITEKVSDINYDMEKLRDDIAADEQSAADYRAQINAIETEMRAGDRVSRQENPVVFGPGITKKQKMTTWGAGLGAFGLVVFGISWWEFRGRKINSLDEVVRDLGLRVVGALPPLPDRNAARRLPSRDAFQPNYLIESVDTTRTMLLHAANREGLRTVMVTSARSGEGKTSLSIQLAASLARAGRKTLFIDGDLRSPAAHQVFNLPYGPGFSELIRGEIDLAGTIQPTSVRGLWMMPAGKWTSHATEALSRDSVKPLFEQLKQEFDFIIIDSSPILAVVDALLLGQQVDAAIFSILHEVSHSPSVYAAHQRLESLGVRILGAVVNGVARNQLDYKSDYYYGYPKDAQRVGSATEESPSA
jgi:capsular exopolysaccharide synthesis family protein